MNPKYVTKNVVTKIFENYNIRQIFNDKNYGIYLNKTLCAILV